MVDGIILTPNSKPVDEAQSGAEGQGVSASYIPSDEIGVDSEEGSSDSSSISGTSGHSKNPRTNSSTESEESHNYIRNDQIFGQADGGVDNILDDIINNNDSYFIEENGMLILNSDALEKAYQKLESLAALRYMLAKTEDKKREARRLIFEAMSNIDFSDAGDSDKLSLSEGVVKGNKKIMDAVNKALVKMMQHAMTHNDKVYQNMLKRAGQQCDDIDEMIGDFFTGGANQEKQLKMTRDAYVYYRNVMQKNLDAFKTITGGSAGLSDIANNKTKGIFGKVLKADDFIVLDKDGRYIDLPRTKDWIADLRSQLVGVLNVNRVAVDYFVTKENATKMIFEALSDLRSAKGNFDMAEEKVEEASGHALQIFDSISNLTLGKQKMENQVRYQNIQIKKFEENAWLRITASAAMIGAAACALVGSIFTGGATALAFLGAAAALGAISAGATYGAAEMANAVEDEYKPSSSTFNPSSIVRPKSGQSKGARIGEAMQVTADDILEEIGFDQLDENKDGYLSINYDKLAKLTKQLQSVQNAIRMLVRVQKERASKARLISWALGGVRGGDGTDLKSSAIESILGQEMIMFNALTSNLQEISQAHNWERQQEQALKEARIKFGFNMLFAVASSLLGGMLGGAAGALTGWAIGQAVGSAVAEYLCAKGAFGGGSYDMQEYDPANYNPVKDMQKLKSKSIKKIAESMARSELEIYKDLLKNGICSSGDGYWGIDSKAVGQLQRRLEKLLNAFTNIVCLREMKERMKDAINNAFGKTTERSISDLNLVQAHIQTSLEVFTQIKSLLNEQITVHNRIRDAEKRFTMAQIQMGITAGLSASAYFTSAFTSITNGVIASAQIVGNILSITSSAMSLVNGVVNAVFMGISAYSGYGELGRYVDKVDEARKAGSAEKEEKSKDVEIMRKLDAMEAQVYFDGGVIEEIGGGRWGINTAIFSEFSDRLEAITNTRDGIIESKKILQEIRAVLARVMGQAGPSVSMTAADLVSRTSLAVAQQILEAQFEMMQTITQRHNAMTSAQLQMIKSIINSAIAAVQLVMDICKAVDGAKMKDIQKAMARDMAANPGTQPGESSIKELKQLQAQNIALSFSQLGVKAFSIVTNMTITYIFDAIEEESSEKPSEGKVSKEKEKADSKGGDAELGASLDKLSSSTNALRSATGRISLDIQNVELAAQAAGDLVQGLGELVRFAADVTRQIRMTQNQLDRTSTMVERSKEMEKVARQRTEFEESFRKLEKEKEKLVTVMASARDLPAQESAAVIREAVQSTVNKAQELVSNMQTLQETVSRVSERTEVPAMRPEVTIEQLQEQLKKLQALPVAQGNVQQVAQEAVKIVNEMQRSVSSAQVLSQLAEAQIEPSRVEQIQAQKTAQIQKVIEQASGNKELSKLNPEELQDLYEKLYKEEFMPERDSLQEIVRDRNTALKKVRDAVDPKERSEASAELDQLRSQEGVVRQRIRAFNQAVAKINNAYKAQTGKDLEPVVIAEKAAPSEAPRKPENASKPAEQAKEQFKTLLETVYRPNQKVVEGAQKLLSSITQHKGEPAIDVNKAVESINILLEGNISEETRIQLEQIKELLTNDKIEEAFNKFSEIKPQLGSEVAIARGNISAFKAKAKEILPGSSELIDRDPEAVLKSLQSKNDEKTKEVRAEISESLKATPTKHDVQANAAQVAAASKRDEEKELSKKDLDEWMEFAVQIVDSAASDVKKIGLLQKQLDEQRNKELVNA
ncbi:MAG: hypothetical protein ABIB65_00245 [Candidatus Margulisiibacteriota bacterium]